MTDLDRRLSSDTWIPLVQDALGIEGHIDSLVLDFRSGEFLRIVVNDGEESAVTVRGIMGIKGVLALPNMAQRVTITTRRGHFVKFEVYQFIPLDVVPEDVADLLKGAKIGKPIKRPGAGEE